jgi:hypothetical protein
MTLPMTATARRNARIRAAALASIPVLLFVLAAIPRVWAPDLVPFDPWEATFVVEARAHAADSWARAYAGPTWPALALADPWLRSLPSPVAGWVVVRGLLDALGVAVVYLAVCRLVGPLGATIAGMFYAASPVAWAAARDPAGSLGPLLGAVALLAAVRLVERPTLLRGVLLGVTLGLLARSLPLGVLVAVLGAVSLVSARASWKVGGLTALALVLTAGPAILVPIAAPYNGAAPPNVGPSSPLIESTFATLLPLLALFVLFWRGNVKGGLLFAVVWVCIGVVGWDWVWRVSRRALSSGFLFVETVRAFAESRYSFIGSVLLVSLSVSRLRIGRWCGRIMALVAVGVLVAGLGVSLRYDDRAEWSQAAFTIRDGYSGTLPAGRGRPTGTVYVSPSLREVTAVTDALGEATGRTGTNEVVLLTSRLDSSLSQFPYAVLLDKLHTRSVGTSMVLPLERETIYLMSAFDTVSRQPWLAIEAQRPSSSVSVFTPGGADTGARIFTIRPRPAVDWLARVRAVADGRFVDGSVLLGFDHEARAHWEHVLTLYWQIPAAADGRTLGARAQVLIDGAAPATQGPIPQQSASQPSDPDAKVLQPLSRLRSVPGQEFRAPYGGAPFPTVQARRGGELVVQRVHLILDIGAGRLPALGVAVYDDRNRPIRTVAGAADLALPIGP